MSLILLVLSTVAHAADGYDFEHLAATRSVFAVEVSPDGSHLAYVASNRRPPGASDETRDQSSVYVKATTEVGPGRRWLGPDTGASQVTFSPDSQYLTYLRSNDDGDGRSLWALPLQGGEAFELVEIEGGISAYDLTKDGSRVVVMGPGPADEDREALKGKGYTQEVFEEELTADQAWILPVTSWAPVEPGLTAAGAADPPAPVKMPGAPQQIAWAPDDTHLLVSTTPRPLVDDVYVATSVQLVAPDTGEVVYTAPLQGKVGPYALSPDGSRLAVIGSDNRHDPAPGRLRVGSLQDKELKDAIYRLQGHVRTFRWLSADRLLFVADVGVESQVGTLDLTDNQVEILATSDGTEGQPLVRAVDVSQDGQQVAYLAETPHHPRELYTRAGDTWTRHTHINPWLEEVQLAEQRVVTWRARDGLELQGVMLLPPGDGPHPLIMMVHGGPESHDRNGWVTYYARPGQVAATHGFAVLYPNYRGSTGRGVGFAMSSQGDPAGREFNDLVDAIKPLARQGLIDADRVGITGGSYGGYATAWAATKLTKHFRAGAMFVGVSNLVSKALTTDASQENVLVHMFMEPWVDQKWRLTRSPIAFVEQAKTPLLIAGGTADTRVHPSESLQLYRALKLIGQVPVRYVRYPGEGHGNRATSARDDYARRVVRWMEHFLLEEQSTLPPVEVPLGASVTPPPAEQAEATATEE